MSPVIEAASIAAGVSLLSLVGTVAVAVSGHRTTQKTNSKTIQAGTDNTVRALEAAREDRLWDKRAAAYEEAIAYLLYRKARRGQLFQALYQREDPDERMEQLYGDFKPAPMLEIQGRVTSYSSEAVRAAFESAERADNDFRVIQIMSIPLLRASKDPDSADVLAAKSKIRAADDDAEEKDQELIKLIRNELHSKPSLSLAAATKDQLGAPPDGG
jgi:hypothetical protein